MAMLVFGAMLGTDRRWWPWALVPVAVVLSLGPAMLVMSLPTTLTAFSWFAGVVPLVCAGFVGSPRAFRRFSLEFDGYLKKLPFKVRVEPGAEGKRYVKEGEK